MSYQDLLASKAPRVNANGKEPGLVHPMLFDWQAQIVRWGIKRGCAAFFEDCGLGKTIQQIEWIRQMVTTRGLILAPLSVAEQTIAEAAKLGVEVTYKEAPDDSDGIWITNYERLHLFSPSLFDAIVLDESSILKSLDGKIRTRLLKQFVTIPHRLCCTATPAPNDLVELANHAEFLGVMSRQEMLAMFFVHDSENSGDRGWRLKKHARQDFWRWVAQWAVYIRKPSDLGFDDGGFVLPPLRITEDVVQTDFIPEGHLFPGMVGGITGRTQARRATMTDRVRKAAEMIGGSSEQWLVWCGLNEEGRALAKLLGKRAVVIEGSTPDHLRDQGVRRFLENKCACQFSDNSKTIQSGLNGQHCTCGQGQSGTVLISKPAIFGFGLNFQHCHNVLYLGLNDSFEQWYQSIRRCWRFGQERAVNVRVVTSDAESQIVDNIKRKERQAAEMAAGIVDAMRDAQIDSVRGITRRKDTYKVKTITEDRFTLMLGDCVERIKEVPDGSVGMSIFSPPFSSLYTYSASDRDMGNSKDHKEFFKHFGYLIPELLRVTMPCRRACVHVQQLTMTKISHGVMGWYDFRADVVRAFVESGWIYDGEIVIDKDPQAQAIRTKAKQLMFVQKNTDSVWSRPAMADYILLFRSPGDNLQPVIQGKFSGVTNEEWIRLARPIWYGISESDTLNYQTARENDDERHICPLQLETVRRCVRLWSNPGDVILSPFMGIGTEGHIAMEQGRRFVGIELKESYFNQAEKNIRAAVKQESLFV